MMTPLGKKETPLLQQNLADGETVLGQVIANFGQAVVATDHKVLVIKTGMMAGQTFGGKATTFDYRMIGGVEVRTGFVQGEMEIINPSMPSSQGNRNKDKVKIAETPNGVVFSKQHAPLFQEFAAKVRERAAISLAPSAPAAAPAAMAPSGDSAAASIPDQIRQLAELHAAGILSDAEFEAKKAELLSRM